MTKDNRQGMAMEFANAALGLKILVVSQSRKRLNALMDTLAACPEGHHVIGRLDQAINLPQWVDELLPDLIIMDTDSPSRDTLEQVCLTTQATPRPIVMFTQDGRRESIQSAVQAGVSCYVVDGLKAERVQPLLQLAQARFEEMHAMRLELQRARQELQEHKLVERAKRLLMQQTGLDEDAAYRRLRKEAMSQRLRLADVAGALLKKA